MFSKSDNSYKELIPLRYLQLVKEKHIDHSAEYLVILPPFTKTVL
jgi:hypothetical protein